MFFIKRKKNDSGCFFNCLIKIFSSFMLAQVIYDSILSKNGISMKKFFASFLILALFSLFVFWVGWTQVKIPADSCGIVVSKTHGISQNPVLPGKFSWYWQFLLPTNAQVVKFNIQPLSVSKSFKTSLPSADFIKQALNISSPIDYIFNFDITLSVTPEELVELYRQNKISDEKSLNEYLDLAASYIAQMASNYYIKKADENPKFRPESVRRDDLMRSVQPYTEYPEIEVITVALTSYSLADKELYQTLKARIEFDSLNTINSDTGNENE